MAAGWRVVSIGSICLVVSFACAGDRGSAASANAAGQPETPGPALPVVDASEDAVAPSASADGGAVVDSGAAGASAVAVDGGPADAGGSSTPPLVLKGVRKCTAEEMENEVCFEGKQPGSCLDEYCVTAARCPKYCVAMAAQTHAECESDPKSCEGVAECVRVVKETNKVCVTLRAQSVATCNATLCGFIRSLPPP